jgi:hypothetical protein
VKYANSSAFFGLRPIVPITSFNEYFGSDGKASQ